MPRHSLPKNLIIRATALTDAEGICALSNLPGYRYGTLRPPFQSLAETQAFLASPLQGGIRIVADLDGNIAGSASLNVFQGRRAHAGAFGLGVHDDWTGHGIGTQLLGAIVNAADKWLGLRRLELNVHADNANAIALYHKFGFEVEGTMRAYAMRDGLLITAHAMARLVQPTPVQG